MCPKVCIPIENNRTFLIATKYVSKNASRVAVGCYNPSMLLNCVQTLVGAPGLYISAVCLTVHLLVIRIIRDVLLTPFIDELPLLVAVFPRSYQPIYSQHLCTRKPYNGGSF